MKKYIAIMLALLLPALCCYSANQPQQRNNEPQLRSEVFDLLDLSTPGLEKVAKFHKKGNDQKAAAALLKYFRTRVGVGTPDYPTPQSLKDACPSESQLKWANEALEHKFFVHYGYQPSFFYGEDIDWKYWPVKDNELRWQLHRHKWFAPLGIVYRYTGNEVYAEAWRDQYLDWIHKNPQSDKENARFAWRPLEVSHRVQDQVLQFQLFLPSKVFTPEFLTEFLLNYYNHVDYLTKHYSEKGNHLLFEAQRTFCAGAFFREFKDAAAWRKQGVDVLNEEIKKQVLSDGGHFELDPHYHLACIEIFAKALRIAAVNGYKDAFPQEYYDLVESLINFYGNICFPDYTNPCFSDAKITAEKDILPQYKQWAELFPANAFLQYLATKGTQGALPEHLSIAYPVSGFYVVRDGWGEDAVQFVMKAGMPGFWHSQPDNGTFELWYNGRNLFPDSGSYVYEGSAEVNALRRWFRQSQVHNTVTLDGENFFPYRYSRLEEWAANEKYVDFLIRNVTYEDFVHLRRVHFDIATKVFIITDTIRGDAGGKVNLNYQLNDGPTKINTETFEAQSAYPEGANYELKIYAPKGAEMTVEQGWRSTAYRQKTEREHIIVTADKCPGEEIEFITTIKLYTK